MAEELEFDHSPWGDTDEEKTSHDEDPIELSDEEAPLASKVKKRRTLNPPVRSPTRTDDVEIDRSDTVSPVQQCFQALQAMIKSVCEIL